MAKKSAESSPLTFDLKADLIAVLDKYQEKLGGLSKSEIIRHAISQFNYESFKPVTEPHRQISVRLPVSQKTELVKLAKSKKVSIGELLRAALESLPANPAKASIQPAPKKAAKKVAAKKKTAKKVAKKAAKKATKKTARKAAKKAAPKKVAKKATAKKKTAKKRSKKK